MAERHPVGADRRPFEHRHPQATLIVLVLVLTALASVHRDDSVIFHTLTELVSVGVAWSVFLMLWNARRELDDDGFVLLGIAMLLAGVLDLLHVVAAARIDLFEAVDPADLSTQYWVAGRLLEGAGYLAAALALGRSGPRHLGLPVAAIAATALIVVVSSGSMPSTITPDGRPTAFLLATEAAAATWLLAASLLLWRRRDRLPAMVHRLLQVAIVLGLVGELIFNLAGDLFGVILAEGHFARVAARFAAYLALADLCIDRPRMKLTEQLAQGYRRLERSEQHWRELTESIPDHVLDLDRDLRIRFVSRTREGIAVEDLIGRAVTDLLPPKQGRIVRRILERARDRPGRRRFEASWTAPDGEVLRYECTVVARRENHAVGGLTLVARNVTGRHRQEMIRTARLRISEQAYGRDADDVLQVVVDEAERLTDSRVGFFHLVDSECTRVSLAAWSRRTLDHACSVEADRRHDAIDEAGVWADAARECRPIVHNDFASVSGQRGHPAGHAEIEREIVVPVVRDGWPVALLGVGNKPSPYRDHDVALASELADLAWDIIARKRAEDAREESEERLLRTLANVPGVVYRCRNDEHWTMEFVSQGSVDLTGYDPDDLVGNRILAFNDLIVPEDRETVRRAVEASLETDDRFQVTYRLRHRDGTRRWVWEQGHGVLRGGRLLALEGFIHDITTQHEARLDRERLERRALQTQKIESLGVLAGGIAHDFNNLLQTVLGNAQLAALDVPEGSPVHGNLAQISTAARRAADLTSQMLAYAGQGRFTTTTVDLSGQVRRVFGLLENSFAPHVALRCELARDLPAVHADASQIQQVITNLVINGGEATGAAGGTVTVRTRTRSCTAEDLARNVPAMYPGGHGPEPGEYVELTVHDDGSGIEPDLLDRIFEPFFTTRFTGRGMGLAAVLGILRDHGGALLVETDVGLGTTMRALLPVHVEEAVAQPAAAAAGPIRQALDLTGHTILVVDDESDIRRALEHMLTRSGATVLEATDGDEALDVISAAPAPVDCVMLDLVMPRLDGQACFDQLRERYPTLCVVMMSGHSAQEIAARFAGRRLNGFLAKPFDNRELFEALAAALATSG